MKKKLLSVLLAGALLCGLSVSASAAAVTTGVTQNNGQITVSGAVTNAIAGQQVTVLVVKDGTDLDELTSGDVAYIDQVSATDNYSVSFLMPTTMTYGKYDVYVGGSEVTTLATTEFLLDGTRTLSGNNITTSANGANLTKIWVRVYNAGTDVLVAESNVKADGTFSMLVPSGTFDIKVGREGYLAKSYDNVVVSSDDSSTVVGLKLLAGDINADASINVLDWSALMNVYSKNALLSPEADFNDDISINVLDWSELMINYGKVY